MQQQHQPEAADTITDSTTDRNKRQCYELIPSEAWLVKNALHLKECDSYIKWAEEQGFSEATITIGDGVYKINKSERDNDRIIVDDANFARQLFDRVKSFLPETAGQIGQFKGLGSFGITGFNERLRFYRYNNGQQFKIHQDGAYVRPDQVLPDGNVKKINERSFLTVLFYLNSVPQESGGATNFYSPEVFRNGHNGTDKENDYIQMSVQPVAGDCLIFAHPLVHSGAPCTTEKYVMRTDVMYANKQ